MNLDAYFTRDGSEPMTEFARRMGVNHDQVRQWRNGFRVPSPQNCVAIEGITGRLVMRWDLRPYDWHLIWPELVSCGGSPPVPACA